MSKLLRQFTKMAWAKKYAQRYANEHDVLVRIVVQQYVLGGLKIEVWDDGELIAYQGVDIVKHVHPTGTMRGT